MTNLDFVGGRTGRNTRGHTPLWRVTVNGELVEDLTISEAQISLSKNQHDFVTLICTSSTMTDTEGLTDAPIFFTFGQSPRIEAFFGYIMGVNETSTEVSALKFSLLIVGATRSLQGGAPRFWRDRSISDTLRELVQQSRLGYAGQRHPYLWKSLAQTNESDWAAIIGLAQRLGWNVYNRYGVVMCFDPEKLFEEQGAYVRLVAGREDDFNTQDERTIMDFEGAEESDESPSKIGKKVGFLLGAKPQVVTQAGTFNRYVFNTDLVVRNADEAEIYRTAYDVADSYDNQKAVIRMFGEADLYPGLCVDVTTSNLRLYRGRFDGRWMIDTVIHKMDKTSFQTLLTLSRPGKARKQDIPYSSFWSTENRPRPSMSLDPGVETQGTWVSSWSSGVAR